MTPRRTPTTAALISICAALSIIAIVAALCWLAWTTAGALLGAALSVPDVVLSLGVV